MMAVYPRWPVTDLEWERARATRREGDVRYVRALQHFSGSDRIREAGLVFEYKVEGWLGVPVGRDCGPDCVVNGRTVSLKCSVLRRPFNPSLYSLVPVEHVDEWFEDEFLFGVFEVTSGDMIPTGGLPREELLSRATRYAAGERIGRFKGTARHACYAIPTAQLEAPYVWLERVRGSGDRSLYHSAQLAS